MFVGSCRSCAIAVATVTAAVGCKLGAMLLRSRCGWETVSSGERLAGCCGCGCRCKELRPSSLLLLFSATCIAFDLADDASSDSSAPIAAAAAGAASSWLRVLLRRVVLLQRWSPLVGGCCRAHPLVDPTPSALWLVGHCSLVDWPPPFRVVGTSLADHRRALIIIGAAMLSHSGGGRE